MPRPLNQPKELDFSAQSAHVSLQILHSGIVGIQTINLYSLDGTFSLSLDIRDWSVVDECVINVHSTRS